jgi:hypothetical protein
MPKELPVVCSLGGGDLEQRLAVIAELGAESLVDRRQDGGRHLLRFRSDARTRERLEGIVRAEHECCAFLDLSLADEGGHLVLSVAAPEAGQATADGFAMAFGATRAVKPG